MAGQGVGEAQLAAQVAVISTLPTFQQNSNSHKTASTKQNRREIAANRVAAKACQAMQEQHSEANWQRSEADTSQLRRSEPGRSAEWMRKLAGFLGKTS